MGNCECKRGSSLVDGGNALVESVPMGKVDSLHVGHRQSKKLDLNFPMWLLSVADFMNMSGAPLGHQELREQRLLVEWQQGMFTIFVSHQWISTAHPDPVGEQLQELRTALTSIFAGELQVSSDLYCELLYNSVKSMTPEVVAKLKGAYIWYDYWSIPQVSLAPEEKKAETTEQMKRAVNSIPSYVDRSDVFLALCPEIVHFDTGKVCDSFSWLERGWCRLEMTSHGLSTEHRFEGANIIVLLQSSSYVKYSTALKWIDLPVGLGQFSVESDREMLHTLVGMLLERYINEPISPDDKFGLLKRRIIRANKGKLLRGLTPSVPLTPTTPEPVLEGAGEDCCRCPCQNFLDRYSFKSLSDHGEWGLGPIHCASVEGNGEVLRYAVEAGVDVDLGIQEGVLELALFKGTNPLHLAILQGDPEIVRTLLELGADVVRSNAAGLSPVHIAVANASFSPGFGQLEIVRLLLDNHADIEQGCSFVDTKPLCLAACGTSPKSMELLLQRGATIAKSVNIFGGPLHNTLMWTGGKLEIIDWLLEQGADVNEVPPPNWMGEAMHVAGGFLQTMGFGFEAARVFSEIKGATPLILAAHMGRVGVCATLLRAKADSSVRNERGHSALDLALAGGHKNVAQLLKLGAHAGPC